MREVCSRRRTENLPILGNSHRCSIRRPKTVPAVQAEAGGFPPMGAGDCRRVDVSSKIGTVKSEIHPEYVLANVHCSCGNQFYTRSTKSDLHVELCSECHPFYTGKQKLVDTGGRVERFQRRAAKRSKS